MKLREIYETLCETFQRISVNSNEREMRDIFYDACQWLQRIGAKQIGSGASAIGYELSMPWGKVVVKVSKYGVDFPPAHVLNEYEVLRKHALRPLFWNENFVIQPRADLSGDLEAIAEKLEKLFLSEYEHCFDTHEANVGTYRGREITFDPMMG